MSISKIAYRYLIAACKSRRVLRAVDDQQALKSHLQMAQCWARSRCEPAESLCLESRAIAAPCAQRIAEMTYLRCSGVRI